MSTINTQSYFPAGTSAGTSSASTTNKTTSTSASSSIASGHSNSAIAEFLEYQKMTPEEKLRDAILKKLDLTEEDLAALSPEERAKVEEKIKEMIKQEIENNMAKKGVLVDMTA
ncbi:MAG: hypothetical protein RBR86_00955 [Pseudobdellovibrionaceae bacterium]|jgi:hypothetical protein|nr:hypothetical protein [Pseudobdellovibrionaceae bacterium]